MHPDFILVGDEAAFIKAIERRAMVIENATVFDTDCQFRQKDINIDGERFVEKASDEVIDATGLYAIPGLIDIHFHGCMGFDFCQGTEEAIQAIAEYEAKNGILAICPTTMTYPEEKLNEIMDASANHKNNTGADFVGIHLEGPFLNAGKIGAQNPRYLQAPNAEMFLRLQKRSKGLIKICDIAPEVDSGFDFIKNISKDVRISIAHTCANYKEAKIAFEQGASHMTHLYNAMPGISHREPGPMIAAWESGAEVELIADGIHIHPAVVRMTFQLFGDDKVILVSDSMEACGLQDGIYELGGQAVHKMGNKAVLKDKPETIAGSVINLMQCLKTAVIDMKIPLESCVKAATINPARSIGIEKDYGSIDIGKYGNLVLLDKDMNLVKIIQKGKIIEQYS